MCTEMHSFLNSRSIKMASVFNHNLNQLIQLTGYVFIQTNEQRTYTASGYINSPPKECELFIGKLPRNLFEDELVPVFEKIGPIYQIRIMIDRNGLNRGYGFVTFFHPEIANSAVLLLNNFQIRQNRYISVHKSLDNCFLFVSGISQEKTKDELFQELSKYMFGVKNIIMYNFYGNNHLNRGFAFIEFHNHEFADKARNDFYHTTYLIWGKPIIVDWADPIPDVDSSIMSTVKILYLGNLNIDISSEQLWSYLKTKFPGIVKVYKTMDYAFVHFANRQAAEQALVSLQGTEMNGKPITVNWARPKMYSKKRNFNNKFLQYNFLSSQPGPA